LLPHNEKPNDKIKSSVTKQRRGWGHRLSISFLTVLIGVFCFAGAAQALSYDVSIDDVTVNEGDGTATFTISLDKPVDGGDLWVDINYKTADGSATEPGDYNKIDPPIILRFNVGEQTKPVNVTILDDAIPEPDEDFFVDIGSSGCGSGCSVNFTKNKGTGNITNDDRELKVKVFQAAGVNSVFVDWGTGSQTCSNDTDCLNPDGLFLPVGTVVTLTPIADPSAPDYWMFKEWKKDGSGKDNPYIITLTTTDLQIDAHFSFGDRTLTINAIGSGTGSVTASIGSKSGSGGGTTSTFPAVFAYGWEDVVTLTPAADSGSAFYEWTGYGSGTPVRTVDINDADRSVTVEFRKIYDLTVTTSGGTGSESVDLAPAPISSVGNVHTYFDGTVVTLTANPDTTAPGYSVLKQWTGDASGSTNPTTVTMTADKSVDAGFVNAYKLTMLVPNGTGAGTVDPVTGVHFYEQNTVVNITATPSGVPAPGSVFQQWWDIPPMSASSGKRGHGYGQL
jgi:hypothetical protein